MTTPVDVSVRVAIPEDFGAVLAVERDAFARDDEAELVAALVADDAFVPDLSLVAEVGPRIVGHALFTRAQAGAGSAVLLGPLAVASDMQGVGVGTALVCEGLQRAKALGFGLALVLGHPGYYTQFDFEPAEPHGIMSPYPVEPAEAWMVFELRAGALGGARGVVEVAEAFRHEEMWRE